MKCSLVEVKPSRHELKPIMTNPHESERKMFGEKLFSSHSEQKKKKVVLAVWGGWGEMRNWKDTEIESIQWSYLIKCWLILNIYRSFSRLASLYGSDDLTILRNLLGSLSSFSLLLSHTRKKPSSSSSSTSHIKHESGIRNICVMEGIMWLKDY